jgi:hypothetical protein
MSETTRRQFIQSTSLATGAVATAPMLFSTSAKAQWTNVPENGAKLAGLALEPFCAR